MSLNDEHHNEWQACPPGEVGRLVHRLQDRHRALATQRRMVAAVLLLMTACTGYYFVGVLPNAEPNYGGIVCSRLHELAPQYMAKTLNADTSGRIQLHLAHCKSCRDKLNEMSMNSASRVTRPHEEIALTAHNRHAHPAVVIEGFAFLSR